MKFLESFTSILEHFDDKNVIIGGDLNIYLNQKLDERGGNIEDVQKYASGPISIIEEYNLSEISRLRFPSELNFTGRVNSRPGLIQTRPDYLLIAAS